MMKNDEEYKQQTSSKVLLHGEQLGAVPYRFPYRQEYESAFQVPVKENVHSRVRIKQEKYELMPSRCTQCIIYFFLSGIPCLELRIQTMSLTQDIIRAVFLKDYLRAHNSVLSQVCVSRAFRCINLGILLCLFKDVSTSKNINKAVRE